MGAIQDSINRMGGAIAGATVGMAHISGQKKQAEQKAADAAAKQSANEANEKKAADEKAAKDQEAGQLAKSQYHDASAAVKELEPSADEAAKALESAKGELKAIEGKRPGGKGNTKAALEEKKAKAMTDVEAAQRAFDVLQDKIAAKKAVMERSALIMKRTGVEGGIR